MQTNLHGFTVKCQGVVSASIEPGRALTRILRSHTHTTTLFYKKIKNFIFSYTFFLVYIYIYSFFSLYIDYMELYKLIITLSSCYKLNKLFIWIIYIHKN